MENQSPNPGTFLDKETARAEYLKSIYNYAVPSLLVICFYSFYLNARIVLAYRWCRHPIKPTLMLSVSLASVDAWVSIVQATGLIMNSWLPIVFKVEMGRNNCVQLALEVFRLGGILTSVAHLVGLGVNHWIGTLRPLRYDALVTRKRVRIGIVLSWLLPLGFIFIYSASHAGQGFLVKDCRPVNFLNQSLWRYLFATFFFLPMIVMAGIYVRIYREVSLLSRERGSSGRSPKFQTNTKTVITTSLIIGTYVTGWIPAVLSYVLICHDCIFTQDQVGYETAVPISITVNSLVLLKAVINYYVYAGRMSEMRVALKRLKKDLKTRIMRICSNDPAELEGLVESDRRTVKSEQIPGTSGSFKSYQSVTHRSTKCTNLNETTV